MTEREKIEVSNLAYRRELVKPVMDQLHAMMESVRFTGRMEFRNGKWGGIYGTPERPLRNVGPGRFEEIGAE